MKLTRHQLRKLILESIGLQQCLGQILANAYQRDEAGKRLPHSTVENYLWHEVYHNPNCDFLAAFPQGGDDAIEFQRQVVNAFGYTWEEYTRLSREKTSRIESEIESSFDLAEPDLINEIKLTMDPYPFRIDSDDLNIRDSRKRLEVTGLRIAYQSINYVFDTDDHRYFVSIMLSSYADSPANYHWDISFEAFPLDNIDDGLGFDAGNELTNKNDMRIYATIAAILKDFITNILPTLKDSDLKVFGFSGIKEYAHQAGHHRSDYGKDTSRRTKIYTNLLINNLIPGTKILPSKHKNIVYFKVP